VNYTRSGDGATVVARYRVSIGDANAADPASEEVVLTISQPFANHNGGQLAFGPDGYLYIGMGDGGSGGDPLNNGQAPAPCWENSCASTWSPPRRPTDSPDQPVPGQDRIPPGDLGAGAAEPVAVLLRPRDRGPLSRRRGTGGRRGGRFQPAGDPGGRNYGWNVMEGDRCYPPGTVGCNRTGLALPAFVYDHSLGCSVTVAMWSADRHSLPCRGLSLRGLLQRPDLGDQEERRRVGQRAACGHDVEHIHLRRRRGGEHVRGESRERRPSEDPFPVRS